MRLVARVQQPSRPPAPPLDAHLLRCHQDTPIHVGRELARLILQLQHTVLPRQAALAPHAAAAAATAAAPTAPTAAAAAAASAAAGGKGGVVRGWLLQVSSCMHMGISSGQKVMQLES